MMFYSREDTSIIDWKFNPAFIYAICSDYDLHRMNR